MLNISRKWRWMLLFAVTLTATGCAQTGSNGGEQPLRNVPIPEPLEASFEYEIELGKLNEFLRQDLNSEQRSQLLYRRGALYDALGLKTLARVDFNHALEFDPRMADAYNYLGIHYTVLGEYDYAYEALDSAIELDPEHKFAYLNRGMAAYYDGHATLAENDILRYYEHEPTDPYRVLWLYFAEHLNEPELALQNLRERRTKLNNTEWAVQIVDVFLGTRDPQDFLNSDMRDSSGDSEVVTERLCEAYFYLGKYYQERDEHKHAALYFKLAATTNVFEFVEYRFARTEMRRSLAAMATRSE